MMRRRLVFVTLILLSVNTLAISDRQRIAALPERWRVWLSEEVYPLITSEQRKVFLALATDAERDVFALRLWDVWGAETEYGKSFRQVYEERLNTAREEFKNTSEDRARVFLLHGEPETKLAIDCEVFNPLEIWLWERLPGLGQNVAVLFFKPYGIGQHRLWMPTVEGRSVLYRRAESVSRGSALGPGDMNRQEWQCGDAREILRLIGIAEYWLGDIRTNAAMAHQPLPVTGNKNESASDRFLQYSTVIPQGSATIDFELKALMGGRRGGKVTVVLSTKVARETLSSSKVGEVEIVQLDVIGEIMRDGSMYDRFRYSFTFPADSKEFPIVVERELRPGRYQLRLKVQDSYSSHAGVREAELDVKEPEVSAPNAADKSADDAIGKLATTATKEPTLAVQAPEGEGLTGVQRFSALVGPSVAKVEFYLDNQLLLAKNRAPFEVELDLGPLPRMASVNVVAYDAKGVELDRRQVDLNVGRERFHVRLQPVGASDRRDGKVRAVVNVNVPPDRKLTKLELFWNEGLVATLYTPPFTSWLPVKDDGSIGYLRGLATLDSGEQAEDVRFVNAPQFLTGVQVQTVELPVTVLDRQGKPVEGLLEKDFEVIEDGKSQKVSHFALQQELPIRMGVVLDTSGSMEKTLPDVQRVVAGFLKNLLRPRDRAFVVAFSDRASLVEGFSADFAALEQALIAMRADRGTALYDATVFGLFQFSGVRGRKAMIILTDGEDNASRMDYDRVLDYAQRSGVTIYTIGIDLPISRVVVRSQLSRLAKVTGGDAFFLARAAALQPVYSTINRELRSQYLIAYTSNSEADSQAFRKITVKLKKPGFEVRTLSGYYPGN